MNFDAEHRQAAPGEASLAAVSTSCGRPARIVPNAKHRMKTELYIPLAEIAEVSGVSEYSLMNHYFPDWWAVPRDWSLLHDGSVVIVAKGALPELETSLALAELGEAAERLRTWRHSLKYCPPGQQFIVRHRSSFWRRTAWYHGGQYA